MEEQLQDSSGSYGAILRQCGDAPDVLLCQKIEPRIEDLDERAYADIVFDNGQGPRSDFVIEKFKAIGLKTFHDAADNSPACTEAHDLLRCLDELQSKGDIGECLTFDPTSLDAVEDPSQIR